MLIVISYVEKSKKKNKMKEKKLSVPVKGCLENYAYIAYFLIFVFTVFCMRRTIF